MMILDGKLIMERLEEKRAIRLHPVVVVPSSLVSWTHLACWFGYVEEKSFC